MALFDLFAYLFVVLAAFVPPILLLGFSRQALRLSSDMVLPVGFLGTMVGLVQLLQMMDDPRAVGPGISVALLTAVYAMGFKLLLELLPEDQEAVVAVPFGKRAAAGGFFLAVLLTAIFMGSGLWLFFDVRAVVFVLVGALLIAGLAKFFGRAPVEALVRQLPTLAVLILSSSLLAMVSQLNDPSQIGPTIAWGFLGAFYASSAAVFVRLLALNHVERPASGGQWAAFTALNVGACVVMAQVVLAMVLNGSA